MGYPEKAEIYVRATFTINGVAVDPTTVTCITIDPAAAKVTVTYAGGGLVRVSAGVYQKIIPLTLAGTWFYRFEATGYVVSAAESSFSVDHSNFYGS